MKEEPKTTPESGWLIENTKIGDGPYWYYLDDKEEDGWGWTKDSIKALRFARKSDADAFIADIGWNIVVATEHQWG